MEIRKLGKTGHMSSVVTFGAYAAGVLTQRDADELIELALARGINHFDVAPSYADAEERLGNYLKRHPQPNLFISCKTEKRDRAAAREELLRTMDRLGRSTLDLYQLHAVCNAEHLDACFRTGGSMEALTGALDEGLVANLGITGHGWEGPATHLAALDRYPFATVMTACNMFMYQDPGFRADWTALMERCAMDDVGVHLLKATARIAWGEREPTHTTWYEPFTEPADVNRAVAWALAQPITTLCSAGDSRLLTTICDAADNYRAVGVDEQMSLLGVPAYGDIFANA
jgi:aryl-alcohol dehydrogenase-like predicted oxidoreductase